MRLVNLVSMETVILFYWSAFWLLNGLDKFLIGASLGPFTWYGKDREAQFQDYFQRVGISDDAVVLAIVAIGVWELFMAGIFVIAAFLHFQMARGRWNFIHLGLFASALTFAAFSAIDVVMGDRAELREHGVFFVIAIVSWLAVAYRVSSLRRLEDTDSA